MRPVTVLSAFLAIVAVCAGLQDAEADKPCMGADNRFGVPMDLSAKAYAAIVFDLDGEGPLPESLVVGGAFFHAGGVRVNGIAAWNGNGWSSIGGGILSRADGQVQSPIAWDPDGNGPANEQLIAAGYFFESTGSPGNSIARWDGSAWQPLGLGFGGGVTTLTSWDSDGEGPLASEVVAGGWFTQAGGNPIRSLARWDGASWRGFGTGFTEPAVRIEALTTWDPDGDGPMTEQLILGGYIDRNAGVRLAGIARWDGTSFQPVGAGLVGGSETVRCLLSWDHDNNVATPEHLVAGGFFEQSGNTLLNRIAHWDGSAWLPFAQGLTTLSLAPYSLTVFDRDGSGPAQPELVAGGDFSANYGGLVAWGVARWNGVVWQRFASGIDTSGDGARTLVSWDDDQNPTTTAKLVAAGDFQTADSRPVRSIAAWNGTTWQRLSPGNNPEPLAFHYLSPTISGTPPQLLAGGSFSVLNDQWFSGVVRWDGMAWRGFGGQLAPVFAFAEYDADGNGPAATRLYAGGAIGSFGVGAQAVASWSGSQWMPMPGLFSRNVFLTARTHALCTWDPDGGGPQLPLLAVGGAFQLGQPPLGFDVALWNGTSWQPTGQQGASTGDTTVAIVYALASFDTDGGGPNPERLIAGGQFERMNGVSAKSMAIWNGLQWSSLGSGPGNGVVGRVRALSTWDPDGEGPQRDNLLIAGNLARVADIPAANIALWDGAQVRGLGTGTNGEVELVHTWNVGDSGAEAPQLVATGPFSEAGGVPVPGAALWDGARWRPIPQNFSGPIRAMITSPDDAVGCAPYSLIVGGNFSSVGDLSAGHFAHLTPPDSDLQIDTQPLPSNTCRGGSAVFTTSAFGSGAIEFRWRKDGITLADGPGISGAFSDTLTVIAANEASAGWYDCVVSDECMSLRSESARLEVNVLLGDMNCDCVVSVSDIGGFVLALVDPAGYPAQFPGCLISNGDMNGDGFASVADISNFVSALVGGLP
ncbi:MAG: immunoglobulin domain-containing protein [Phycisphaerae bacterium]|nr:immunoglobulin domain-containing protein [Phycisphaerae bacterium]